MPKRTKEEIAFAEEIAAYFFGKFVGGDPESQQFKDIFTEALLAYELLHGKCIERDTNNGRHI